MTRKVTAVPLSIVMLVLVFASPSRGSFIAAVVCSDGIVVASDSRGTLHNLADKEKTPVAYFDGIQKIFPVGPNALAGYGHGTFSGLFFSSIIEDFGKTEYSRESVDRLISALLVSSSRQYIHDVVDQLWREVMIAAGYIDDEPRICSFDLARSDAGLAFKNCIKSGITETSVTSLDDYDEKTFLSMSSAEVAKLVEDAIGEYAKRTGRQNELGGPISILRVTKNNMTWIKNKPSVQRWQVTQDFLRDLRNRKIELVIIPPFAIDYVERIMGWKPLADY